MNEQLGSLAYADAARLAAMLAPTAPALEAAERALRILQGMPSVMDFATNESLILNRARVAQASSSVLAMAQAAPAHPGGVLAVYLATRQP